MVTDIMGHPVYEKNMDLITQTQYTSSAINQSSLLTMFCLKAV